MVLGDQYYANAGAGVPQQSTWQHQQQQLPQHQTYPSYNNQPFSLPVQPAVIQGYPQQQGGHNMMAMHQGQGQGAYMQTQQLQVQGIPGQVQPVLVIRKPNEVFVGDLSYFCEEKDLFDLFSQYGTVDNCRIVRNDSKNRSLMFGFVCMSNEQEAQAVAKILHNSTFMGRAMK